MLARVLHGHGCPCSRKTMKLANKCIQNIYHFFISFFANYCPDIRTYRKYNRAVVSGFTILPTKWFIIKINCWPTHAFALTNKQFRAISDMTAYAYRPDKIWLAFYLLSIPFNHFICKIVSNLYSNATLSLSDSISHTACKYMMVKLIWQC